MESFPEKKAPLDTAVEIISEKTAHIIKKLFKNTKPCNKKLCRMDNNESCNFAHVGNDLCTYENNCQFLTVPEIDTIKGSLPQLKNKNIIKSKYIIAEAINSFDKQKKNGFFLSTVMLL